MGRGIELDFWFLESQGPHTASLFMKRVESWKIEFYMQ